MYTSRPAAILAGLDSKNLTHEQLEKVKDQVRDRARYFKALADKMESRGFAADDKILNAGREVHEKVQVLWDRLNYLSCEAFKRKFDQNEREIKRQRRLRH